MRWWLAGALTGLLVLAAAEHRSLGAQGGPLPDERAIGEPEVAAQCGPSGAAPAGQPPEGQSVHHDTSPPLQSLTPVPPAPPASAYLVPLPAGETCVPAAGAAPTIVAVEPAAGSVGMTVTIRGDGFTPTDNAVYFGRGYVPQLGSPDGVTLVFVVPDSLNPPCLFASPPCRVPSLATPPGTYEVAVANGNGVSNRAAFTVAASAP